MILRFFTFLLVIPCWAGAQTFKVEKVKGNKALIEMTSGRLNPGQNYSLSESYKDHQLSRNYLIGLKGLSLSLTSDSTESGSATTSITSFSFLGSMGWNYETIELGPTLRLVNSNSDGRTTSTYGFGGFIDYNFTPNVVGTSWIWGLGAAIEMSTLDAGGSKSNNTELLAGVFLKWFIFSETFCLRSDLNIKYAEAKNDLVTQKSKGFVLSSGITHYF